MSLDGNPEASATLPRDSRQPADFDPVAEAKRLLRVIRSGTLATLAEDGSPFATLTAFATDYDGGPLLLLSRLAAHTRNLERDPRCSLLLAQGGRGDPLAHPRLTLVARLAPTADPRARGRFLRRNPKAELYADFADFAFWRAEIDGVHLNGGFARAADFDPQHLLTNTQGAVALIAAEEEILAELNSGRTGTLASLAPTGAEAAAGAWRASGLDPEGLDLVCADAAARVAFPRRAETPDQARGILAELARAPRDG